MHVGNIKYCPYWRHRTISLNRQKKTWWNLAPPRLSAPEDGGMPLALDQPFAPFYGILLSWPYRKRGASSSSISSKVFYFLSHARTLGGSHRTEPKVGRERAHIIPHRMHTREGGGGGKYEGKASRNVRTCASRLYTSASFSQNDQGEKYVNHLKYKNKLISFEQQPRPPAFEGQAAHPPKRFSPPSAIR